MVKRHIDKNYIETSEILVSAQNLTSSYVDFGSQIDCISYNRLGLFVISDCNDSQDVDLKVVGLYNSSSADEFEIDGLSVKRLWSGTGTDSKVYYEFDTGTIPYIKIKAKAGTVGSTAGNLTIYLNKSWIN